MRERKNEDKSKDKSTKRTILLSIFLAIIIGNVFANVRYLRIVGSFRSHLVIGVIVIWVGILFRFWAIQTLGRFYRTTVMIQEGHRVIKNGPYRILRHPSYAGSLLSILGIAIGMSNWIGLILMLSMVFAAYRKRIIVEEKVLQESLGKEYQDYVKNTKKLVPFIY